MDILAESWVAARDFFERGGGVLLVLGFIIFTMWALILNRWLYLRAEYRADVAPLLSRWTNLADKNSSFASRLKNQSLESVASRLNAGFPLIRTLAAICPLLGLLGTVVGMITVFQMMGAADAGSPRVVASGVSTAMVTTMAGMVGALSGVFPVAMLARRARAHMDQLQSDEGMLPNTESNVSQLRPMRLRRHLIAPAGAFFITFLLVFGMERMILIGRIALIEPGSRFAVEFVRVERNEAPVRKEKPDKPPEPTEQPQMPAPQTAVSNFATAIRVAAAAPPVTMNTGTGIGATGFAVTDGEYLPIVKVGPVYPARAAVRGIEGHVIVEYTVTASGDTRDVVVIESTDVIFNNAALESARKYKFVPRVIDGVPVDVAGVTTLIIFELNQTEEEG